MTDQEIKEAKELIRKRLIESKKSHLSWIKYYEENPEQEEMYADSVGDMTLQKKCVEEYEEALQALALLSKQPPPMAQALHQNGTGQAGEFTKECRELIKTQDDDKGWNTLLGYVTWLETKLSIACDRLDQLEAEKKACYTRIAKIGDENTKRLGEIREFEAEKERLKDFAEWLLRHITDTTNTGFVIKNTDPQTIKLKAEQALKGKTNVKDR